MTRLLIALMLMFGVTCHAMAENDELKDAETLRAELDQARSDLAEAAQRVASLTRQLSEQGLARRWAELDGEQWRSMIGELPDGTAIRRAIAMAWAPRLGVVMSADEGVDGRLVRAVTPGSSAAAAGIEVGDRLISVDGVDLGPQAAAELRQMLRERQVGDTVIMELERDGERRSTEVVLERPELPRMTTLRGDGEGINLEGLSELLEGTLRPGRVATIGRQTQLTPMHAGLEPYFGVDQGILVLRIEDNNELELLAGDVILSLNGERLTLPADLLRQSNAEPVTLEIMRHGEIIQLSGHWDVERVRAFMYRRQAGND